jgi:hypothetical protein
LALDELLVFLDENHQMIQRIAAGIEQGDGFFRGAMQRAGIDHAHLADSLVANLVRVAMKEKIILFPGDESFHEAFIVAMGDGDFFSIDFEFGELAAAIQAECGGIIGQLRLADVGISPHESRFDAGQEIEHAFAADVTAVDESFGSAFFERRDSRRGGFDVIVRVAENSDEHFL